MPTETAPTEVKYLARTTPEIPLEEVRAFAARGYGLEGDFHPLTSERDQNYRITTSDGQAYVLKVSNAEEDPGAIDFQIGALRHIGQTAPDVPVPRVIPTRAEAATTTITGPGDVPHIVHCLSYLPGRPLEEAPLSQRLIADIGGTTARLDRALRGFHHPAAGQALLWHIHLLPQLHAQGVHIQDADLRGQIARVIEEFNTAVLPDLTRLRAQVIHHDANGSNLIVDAEQADRIAGVIDFGDMTHAALACEPAVTAADLFKAPDLLDRLCPLVAAYDAVLPLEDEEIDLIYDLVLARLAITVVIIAARNYGPAPDGYMIDLESCFHRRLDALMSLGRHQVRGALRKACRFPPYCPTAPDPAAEADSAALIQRRHRVLGKTLGLTYSRPLHVVAGRGTWLFGADGQRYLDAYNNVPQVGHAHPHVVRAVARQAAALNTNTRYLFENILEYAERLAALTPGELSACLFVNSGSEANDAAYRMAKVSTGKTGAIVVEQAYHGITDALVPLSPYDLDDGAPAPHVRTFLAPDPYRGPHRAGEADLAEKYAADVERAIGELENAGHGLAAFMVDSGFTSNGIPEVPEGYLARVVEKVRAAGGLVIADEVQVGLARSGSHFWGFQRHGIAPDMVTLGKPVGNGYPLGVVISSHGLREHFGAETDFFSTFGGNPVACAAGLAVLEVIEHEGLMENARRTGDRLRAGIRELMDRHETIGDVRGYGLLTGVDLVRDRPTREPATAETKKVLDHMRENRVLIGREGRHGNVLKIRPPLAFQERHVERVVEALDKALAAL